MPNDRESAEALIEAICASVKKETANYRNLREMEEATGVPKATLSWITGAQPMTRTGELKLRYKAPRMAAKTIDKLLTSPAFSESTKWFAQQYQSMFGKKNAAP
jgi:hypothetical protein